MRNTHISIILFIAIPLILLGGCERKDKINSSNEFVQETPELKSGRYIYGDINSFINRETILINTDDNSITYSSSPISSYLTYGEYSNSDGNNYMFRDEKGSKQSFTLEEDSIYYKNKSFIYYNESDLESAVSTDNSLNELNSDNDYNQFDKGTMEIVEGTITSTGLTVRFTSTNENETIYGSYYRVEKYEDSGWKEVQQLKLEGELGWTSEAYIVPSNENSDCVINWEWLYGELTTGQYRIIKDIMDFRGTGDYDKYFLADDFEIE